MPVADIQHTLDAWRDQGADRLDPVRFQLIQGITSRANRLSEGNAKRDLHERLSQLVEQYALLVNRTPTAATDDVATAAPSVAPQATALADLLTHVATLASADRATSGSNSVDNLREHYPELPVLDEFRSTWSKVSAIGQVRQSETQVHENAGPLNSNHLIHRALSIMRDVSPGYLHQFLSYIDTLTWMEQLHLSTEPPAKSAKRGTAKSATTKNTKAPTSKKRTTTVTRSKATTSKTKKKTSKSDVV